MARRAAYSDPTGFSPRKLKECDIISFEFELLINSSDSK